jgi:phage host-nuclease inhibitor protein Gam
VTAPAFELPSDAEEADELRAIGVALEAPMGSAEIDALASELLGRAIAAQADLTRYVAAERHEIMRIEARYDALKSPVVARLRALSEAVCTLAERADFGKAKSRRVGNGTYGRRAIPARVAVMDTAALLVWAKRNAPGLVRTKITEDVPQRAVAQHLDSTGELADGCEYLAARDEPFAKPDTSDGVAP